MKLKVSSFSTKTTLNLRGQLLDLSRGLVMGILNLTPDSFYDGGHYQSPDAIRTRAQQILAEGANIIDIGAQSTRPGANPVDEEWERQQVVEAISLILSDAPQAIISVDTFRASVALAAADAGALIINDVSGGELDPDMFKTVAALQLPYVLMHMRGNPETMNQQTEYEDLMVDVMDYLQNKVAALRRHGVKDVVIDPGFGFAKTPSQSLLLLNRLSELQLLGLPMLVGISRKSMVYQSLGVTPDQALNGTTALHMLALSKGAQILRVHDIKEAVEAVKLFHLTKDQT